MVCRPCEAVVQSAELGVRPGLTVLYVLIAVAGWRTFVRDRAGFPMKLWWGQLALNFIWSPVFFAYPYSKL
jgi:tryptophan-rich sensory protein